MGNSINIGYSALRAAQTGMDVVGQNLANANTPGYHRQSVLLSASRPIYMGGLEFGTGVEIGRIRRIRDRLLESMLSGNQSAIGENGALWDVTRNIESMLTPGAGSLDDRLEKFYTSMDALSARPSDPLARANIIQNGHQLAETLNQLATDLDEIAKEIERQIADTLGQIDVIGQQVADLNQRIAKNKHLGLDTGVLSNQRDGLLVDLSELVDVKLDEVADTVIVADGPSLFGEGSSAAFDMEVEDGQISLKRRVGGAELVPASGQLSGLITARNEVLPSLHEAIDEISRALSNAIDPIHVQGVGLAGGFEQLTSSRNVADVDAALASQSLGFPVSAGELIIAVEDSTGERILTTLAIDPESDSLRDVADAISQVPNLRADVDDKNGLLRISASPGFAFNFTGTAPVTPDTSGILGSTVPQVGGAYAGQGNDRYEFRFSGAGTIGVTPGLKLDVTDQAGTAIAQLNVGEGYSPDSMLNVGNGIRLHLSAGSVAAGDVFSTPAIAVTDSSGVLTRLGVNTFFTGYDARSLSVHQDLLADSNRFASSRDGNPGDSSNLTAMIFHRIAGSVAGLSAEELTHNLIGIIGAEVHRYASTDEHLAVVYESLFAQQASVSGVDENEELVTMLQFQRSFQLAARYLSIISDLTTELMQIAR